MLDSCNEAHDVDQRSRSSASTIGTVLNRLKLGMWRRKQGGHQVDLHNARS